MWRTVLRALALFALVAPVIWAYPEAGVLASDPTNDTSTPPPTPSTPTPTPPTPPPTPSTPTPTPPSSSPSPSPSTKTPKPKPPPGSGSGSGGTPPPPVTTTTNAPPPTTTAPPTSSPPPTSTATPPPSTTNPTSKPTTKHPKPSDSGSGDVQSSGSGSANTNTTPVPAETSKTKSSGQSYEYIIGGGVIGVVVLLALFIVVRRHQRRKEKDEQERLDREMDVEMGEMMAAAAAAARASNQLQRQSLVPNGSNPMSRGSASKKSRDSYGRDYSQSDRSSALTSGSAPYKSMARSPVSWSTTASSTNADTESLSPIWKDPSILAARIPFEKVRIGDTLSRGGFGEVLLGVYHNQRVAIKRLLPEDRKKMACLEDFLREIKLLASLDHERIVSFVGVAWDSPRDLCILLEYMTRGDLRQVLNEWRTQGLKTGWDVRKLNIALNVTDGLTYLHTLRPKIVHRDLKSKNILLNNEWIAKLSDFGISREESSRQTMTSNVGSSLWIAPEVMMGNNYDEKADIYSFGIVLTELDSHQLPYHNVTTPDGRKVPDAAILHMVTMGKIQAEFSAMSRTDIVLLGRSCLALDPTQRPTAAELRYRLQQILKSM